MSTLYAPTLKEDPSDADIASANACWCAPA